MSNQLNQSGFYNLGATNEEDNLYASSTRKQNPSEINAENLQIINLGHQNRRIDTNAEPGTLLMKIYYKKKQFIWEYTDRSSIEDNKRKKKYEIKFSDIISISIKARENDSGDIIIDTNRPIAQFD
jgi:hypothetical protein